MTGAEFVQQLDIYKDEVKTLTENLREVDKLDFFQERVAQSLIELINYYRTVGDVVEVKAKKDDVHLNRLVALAWKSAYQRLASILRTGYSHEVSEVRARAEAAAHSMMADWLDQVDRHGRGNILGLRLPVRVE